MFNGLLAIVIKTNFTKTYLFLMTSRVETYEIPSFEASLMGLHCLHMSIYGILNINGLNSMKQKNAKELHYVVITTKPYRGTLYMDKLMGS